MTVPAEPEKNFVHPDIAKALGTKLLEPSKITREFMEKSIREARREMKRLALSSRLRALTKDCVADCGPLTRKDVRAILDEFEKLDEEKP